MWAGAAVIEKCTPAAYLFRALASKFTLKQEKTKQNKKNIVIITNLLQLETITITHHVETSN